CSVFGVRCSVFGVRCSVFGVRCSVFGVRCSVFGVRCSVFGNYHRFKNKKAKQYNLFGFIRIPLSLAPILPCSRQ
ncbi:MAG: hypothetical protein R3203_05545, partial [Pseudoalteromonas tetraodonis]|nr:hypothetical protein [Pseudoalteromonas tetraodonis]